MSFKSELINLEHCLHFAIVPKISTVKLPEKTPKKIHNRKMLNDIKLALNILIISIAAKNVVPYSALGLSAWVRNEYPMLTFNETLIIVGALIHSTPTVYQVYQHQKEELDKTVNKLLAMRG